jgi:hypothetical protein
LAEREHGIFGIWVELYYHILDLRRAGNERSWRGEVQVAMVEYLVSPEKFITVPVFQTEPGIHELIYTVAAHMFRKVFCLIPVERCSERQEAHDLKDGM